MKWYLPLLTLLLFSACNSHTDQQATTVKPDDSVHEKKTGVRYADISFPDSIDKQAWGGSFIKLTMTPLEFLKFHRVGNMNPYNEDFITAGEAPKGWLKKSDIAGLIPYLDSNSVAAYAVYRNPSILNIIFQGHGYSTMAREAYWLIESYKDSLIYPPWATIPGIYEERKGGIKPLPDSLRTEILNWWKKESVTSQK